MSFDKIVFLSHRSSLFRVSTNLNPDQTLALKPDKERVSHAARSEGLTETVKPITKGVGCVKLGVGK